MFAQTVESALQLLFPTRCSACDELCDEGGAAFCRTCSITLEPIAAACARCSLPLSQSAPRCLGCMRRAPRFDAARAPFEFGGALAGAIRRLKWAGRPELARPLASLLPVDALAGVDLLVPVPLHAARLRRREFNQAALLALSLQTAARRRHRGRHRARDRARQRAHQDPAPPPVDLGALERVRDTAPQAWLAPADRRDNVRGAFWADSARVAGRHVLVVDDVMTTGATADACAEALLAAGAVRVAVLTVARAVP